LLQARSLLKKGGEEVPIEVLNNIAVIHFEREELEVYRVLF
jgi:RNA polymerase-associated protein CTR9